MGEDLQAEQGKSRKSQGRSTSSCVEKSDPGDWRRALTLSSSGDRELPSNCCIS